MIPLLDLRRVEVRSRDAESFNVNNRQRAPVLRLIARGAHPSINGTGLLSRMPWHASILYFSLIFRKVTLLMWPSRIVTSTSTAAMRVVLMVVLRFGSCFEQFPRRRHLHDCSLGFVMIRDVLVTNPLNL